MCLDWIIFGEVCGVEVFDMFNVMNIGYEGLFVMIYVNMLCDVLMWFENMVSVFGFMLLLKMMC